jgi:hypothetical protein
VTKDEQRLLQVITDNPGIQAADIRPRHLRHQLRTLELNNLIHYGPGGWFVVPGKEST